jgi:hypothetical protein
MRGQKVERDETNRGYGSARGHANPLEFLLVLSNFRASSSPFCVPFLGFSVETSAAVLLAVFQL